MLEGWGMLLNCMVEYQYYHEVGYNNLIPAYAKCEWTWVQYYKVDVYTVRVTLYEVLTYSAIKLCCCVCK